MGRGLEQLWEKPFFHWNDPFLRPRSQGTFTPPPVIMEGIDGLSMNIIVDVFTPVRATAAAQRLNAAHASVQLPDSLCNHWQTDLNRFVGRDCQLFRTESFAKKRRLEAVLQTFGGNIWLSIPPEASVPDLLGKLKALCVYLSSGFKGQCFNYVIPIAKSYPPMTSLPYLGLVVLPLRTPRGDLARRVSN